MEWKVESGEWRWGRRRYRSDGEGDEDGDEDGKCGELASDTCFEAIFQPIDGFCRGIFCKPRLVL